MRMAALVAVDGVLPLGPDFVDKVTSFFDSADAGQLESNAAYKEVSEMIPGSNSTERFAFIKQTFGSAKEYMSGIQKAHNLTPSTVVDKLKSGIEFADDKLDYAAAFLDATTSYFQHTGTQTVALYLIERAAKDVAAEIAKQEAEAARLKAEAEAKQKAADEARVKAEEAARQKSAEEAARLQAEAAAKQKAAAEAAAQEAARQKAAEEARVKAEAEAKQKAAEEAAKLATVQKRTYTVKSGDSLSKISLAIYGHAARWPEIFEANKDKIKDPNMIHPGQELIIP
jgi:LysM repeat protein